MDPKKRRLLSMRKRIQDLFDEFGGEIQELGESLINSMNSLEMEMKPPEPLKDKKPFYAIKGQTTEDITREGIEEIIKYLHTRKTDIYPEGLYKNIKRNGYTITFDSVNFADDVCRDICTATAIEKENDLARFTLHYHYDQGHDQAAGRPILDWMADYCHHYTITIAEVTHG